MDKILTDLWSLTFLIWKNDICWISGDELFSDTYPMTLKDNVMYEIVGKVCLLNFDSYRFLVLGLILEFDEFLQKLWILSKLKG